MKESAHRQGQRMWIRQKLKVWASIEVLFLLYAIFSASPLTAHAASSEALSHTGNWSTPGIGGLNISATGDTVSSAGNWPTYLASNARTSFNPAETTINPTTVSHLKLHWIHMAQSSVSTQPVETNGQIYWGSWDGDEHGTDLNNTRTWTTKLGRTTDLTCRPPTVGIASTATATSITISGISTPVIFVGGGNSYFYALNASTGAIIWRTFLGAAPSHFLWSSPAVFQSHIYVGVASFGDCPLVQGQLVEMDMTTGVVQNTFAVVPTGCTGGGVWGSPTIDEATGTIYFATGNPGACSTTETLATALIAVNAVDLSLKAFWQLPPAEQVVDGDFGSTPTLFTTSIKGTQRSLVGIVSKNGKYYAFDRSALHNGPLWRAIIAPSGDCPECGQGSIVPAVWDGSALYAAGGSTTIGGKPCKGSVQALHPDTGLPIWQHCLRSGPVLGAVTGVPGLVVAAQGSDFNILATRTGQTLFYYHDSHPNAFFAGAASISNGVLYIGNQDGELYAFGL